ncbi:MAG: SDR family NAD(P)-dependent oxidoreductase [Pseudomonadota bacterium]
MKFKETVVLVTGASRGLGAAFATYLAESGATVAINSTGSNDAGENLTKALSNAGHQALYVPGPAEQGQKLVEEVLSQAGRIDAIVHNAGFVRDKTIRKMTSTQWDEVLDLHLKASYQLSQAAWASFEEQGGGRLVFVSSSAGLYGNFGQGNYAAAKMGMYGLCQSIALEGAAANICCNCVAPFGATELNSANMDEDFKSLIKAEYIAPLIAYLSHPECTETGGMFEASAGSFKKLRWERSKGLRLNPTEDMSLSALADGWPKVIDFTASEHPTDMRNALRAMYER